MNGQNFERFAQDVCRRFDKIVDAFESWIPNAWPRPKIRLAVWTQEHSSPAGEGIEKFRRGRLRVAELDHNSPATNSPIFRDLTSLLEVRKSTRARARMRARQPGEQGSASSIERVRIA